MGGSGSGRKRRDPSSDPARLDANVALDDLFDCQTPMAGGPPTCMKMGGRQQLFDNSGTRPFTIFNFQRSVKHLPPTPYDENGQPPYCTSNSIHEARAKRSFLFDSIIHRADPATSRGLMIKC